MLPWVTMSGTLAFSSCQLGIRTLTIKSLFLGNASLTLQFGTGWLLPSPTLLTPLG